MLSQKIPWYYSFPVIILSTLFAVILIYAWQEPTAPPPGGNVPAPINVGSNLQYKSGALGVGGLSVDYGANLATLGGDVKVGTTSHPATFQVSGTTTFNGNVSATAFIGDGSQLTGIGSAAIPKGVIVMWSGKISDIPSGWALCDGTNGTPDLRDKFVYGVSAGENPGATGGALTHHHSVGSVKVGFYCYQSGSDNWGATESNSYDTTVRSRNKIVGDYQQGNWYNEIIGGGARALGYHTNVGYLELRAHEHTTGEASSLPPYYKLAYIMKL